MSSDTVKRRWLGRWTDTLVLVAWFAGSVFVAVKMMDSTKTTSQIIVFSCALLFAYLLPFAIAASIYAAIRKYTNEQRSGAIGKMIAVAVVGPFVIWGVVLLWQWFGTIPSWAGAIIILLAIIASRLNREN